MKHPLDMHHRRRMRARAAPGGRLRPRHRHSPAWRMGGRELLGMIAASVIGGLAWSMLPEVEAHDVAPQDATASFIAGPAPHVRFAFCHQGGGQDCVVDGDTFRMGGVKIRIADIDTPETHPPRCAREAELGAAAARRLHALLNNGGIRLHPVDRDADRYGRKLRIVTVDGRGVGDMLVREGLARRYRGGMRQSWCDA